MLVSLEKLIEALDKCEFPTASNLVKVRGQLKLIMDGVGIVNEIDERTIKDLINNKISVLNASEEEATYLVLRDTLAKLKTELLKSEKSSESEKSTESAEPSRLPAKRRIAADGGEPTEKNPDTVEPSESDGVSESEKSPESVEPSRLPAKRRIAADGGDPTEKNPDTVEPQNNMNNLIPLPSTHSKDTLDPNNSPTTLNNSKIEPPSFMINNYFGSEEEQDMENNQSSQEKWIK